MQDLTSSSCDAAQFLKAIASPHRLRILCLLSEGKKNVTEIIEGTGLPQTSVSQHLKKLKSEGIIDFERSHRTLTYQITDKDAAKILTVLYKRFC